MLYHDPWVNSTCCWNGDAGCQTWPFFLRWINGGSMKVCNVMVGHVPYFTSIDENFFIRSEIQLVTEIYCWRETDVWVWPILHSFVDVKIIDRIMSNNICWLVWECAIVLVTQWNPCVGNTCWYHRILLGLDISVSLSAFRRHYLKTSTLSALMVLNMVPMSPSCSLIKETTILLTK